MTDTTNDDPSCTFYPGHRAIERPDHPAIVMASDGTTLTYRELDEHANQISHLFRSAGLAPGDHIAFCMENRIEFLVVAWAAHYAGLLYTAISSRLTPDEIAYIVNDCGARGFITTPAKADAAASIADRIDNVELRLSVGGPVDGYEALEPAAANESIEPLPDRHETTDMLYSSGTTGRPKGVLIEPSGEPLGTPTPLLAMMTALFGAGSNAVYLSPAPLYHAAPLRFCMGMLRVGATVVVMERFDPEHALRLIEQYGVTTSQWVPTMFVKMLKLPSEVRERYDLSTLGVAIHAAAPCPVAAKEQMIEWWGPVLHEYYAGTEGNGLCYTNSVDWLSHRGTVGRPIMGEVHIVDDAGDEVPVGEVGAVYFSGTGSFEYHNDPDKTSESRLGNGWSTLGDIGRVDEDGFLYLTDRRAYMIITGGVNVYPQEAENILTMHPAVVDVAVLGVPNDEFGEEVKAVVQPVQMPACDQDGAQLERELIAYCRQQLADVKCPRSVDFRDELPRHPTGKLYKRLLKDEYWANSESRI